MMNWDWLEGIGDSYVPDHETRGYSKQDRLLYLKRWGPAWTELPPCPLNLI